jgi:hypothetical protein
VQQVTAEEQTAAEKWQVKVAESRWMWSEYQSKWPPAERSSPDRSTGSPGSWHGDGNRLLEAPENSRVEAECDRIAKREEDRISPAMRSIESQDPHRHLIGFEHRLKGRDRIKEKVCDKIEEFSYSAEEALRLMQNLAVNPSTGFLARLLQKSRTRLTNTRQRLLRPIERRFLSQTFHDGEAVAVRAYVRTGRRSTRRT